MANHDQEEKLKQETEKPKELSPEELTKQAGQQQKEKIAAGALLEAERGNEVEALKQEFLKRQFLLIEDDPRLSSILGSLKEARGTGEGDAGIAHAGNLQLAESEIEKLVESGDLFLIADLSFPFSEGRETNDYAGLKAIKHAQETVNQWNQGHPDKQRTLETIINSTSLGNFVDGDITLEKVREQFGDSVVGVNTDKTADSAKTTSAVRAEIEKHLKGKIQSE